GIASGAALIAGTQGLAVAPASVGAVAAKQVGFSLALVNALDIGKGVRGLKQRMRNDKAREIDRNMLRERTTLDARGIDGETPDEAIKGIHAALTDNGRIEADGKRFGKVFPGRWINEKKSTANKDAMADLTARHAMTIIDRSIDRFAGEGHAKLHAFYQRIHAKHASTSRQKRALRDAIDHDADLMNAYHLMRDLGMRGGEARVAIESLIVRRIEAGLANDPATSRARATDAGRKYAAQAASGERAPDDVTAMRTVMQRR
ncbi:sigma-E factor negative regulatory protein, partial [Paraburkholderia sp. Se-20369]|nr:sigma-E factor negative regulatory protein [Paraburkholderia sp. Se-20369]